MSRLSHTSVTSSPLPKVVAAAALGALVGTRSRTAGAVVLAGLTWLATRRPTAQAADSSEVAVPSPSPSPMPTVQPSSSAQKLAEVFPASDPFIVQDALEPESMFESEAAALASAPDWDALRANLAPPPSLWPPSPPVEVEVPFSEPIPPLRPPSSPLLQSAPVFVEVPESASPFGGGNSPTKAVLPDTISIPTTPDPPPGLLAATDLSQPPPQPVASSLPPLEEKSESKTKPRPGIPDTFGLPYVPPAPKRKGFLGWLRSE